MQNMQELLDSVYRQGQGCYAAVAGQFFAALDWEEATQAMVYLTGTSKGLRRQLVGLCQKTMYHARQKSLQTTQTTTILGRRLGE